MFIALKTEKYVLTECTFYTDTRSDLYECCKRVCDNFDSLNNDDN